MLGSATQAFRAAKPAATAMMTALLIIPAAGHLAEYAVHRLAGTPRLGQSIGVSVAFTGVTTAFNLFAMRRGVLIVGEGAQSLSADVRHMPQLIRAFLRALFGGALVVLTQMQRIGGTWLFRRCI